MNGLGFVSVCEGDLRRIRIISHRNSIFVSNLSQFCRHDWLVTLTKVRQQTNTPNTHTGSLLYIHHGVIWHALHCSRALIGSRINKPDLSSLKKYYCKAKQNRRERMVLRRKPSSFHCAIHMWHKLVIILFNFVITTGVGLVEYVDCVFLLASTRFELDRYIFLLRSL